MISNKKTIFAIAIAGLLMAHPAFADKPDHAGHGNNQGHQQKPQEKQQDKHQDKQQDKQQDNHRDEQGGSRDHGDHRQGDDARGGDVSIDLHFNDRQRTYIHDYYRDQFSHGDCPPGLAKKHNGCMPPGQAKKWRIGYPLDRTVVYYDLPPSIVVELGQPPRGYRYVRVAADILMIAVGSGIVMDAVADLAGR